MRKRVIILSIILISSFYLLQCAWPEKTETLTAIKSGLNCLEYKQGMKWKVIQAQFGNPDLTPIPQPDQTLSENARVYKSKTLIFYTELKKTQAGGRIRYEEVITKLEICDEK